MGETEHDWNKASKINQYRRIRLSTDRRQWYAIGGLAVLIFILILLLFS